MRICRSLQIHICFLLFEVLVFILLLVCLGNHCLSLLNWIKTFLSVHFLHNSHFQALSEFKLIYMGLCDMTYFHPTAVFFHRRICLLLLLSWQMFWRAPFFSATNTANSCFAMSTGLNHQYLIPKNH